MSVKQVAPNIYEIRTFMEETRIVNCYLLKGVKNNILIDTSTKEGAKNVLVPEIRNILKNENLESIIITHAHADHFGGNSELKKQYPSANIYVHYKDSEWVEDKEKYIREAYYNEKQDEMKYSNEIINWGASMLGKNTEVNWVLYGGETIKLEKDWKVKIFHTPGHTRGHLSLYDDKNKIIFGGEAILGKGEIIDNVLTQPPAYIDVRDYKKTLSIYENLGLEAEYLFLTHSNLIKGRKKINNYIKQSREVLENYEKTIKDYISHSKPLGLKEICEYMNKKYGPCNGGILSWKSLVLGHIRDMILREEAEEHYFLDNRRSWRKRGDF